MSIAGMKVVYRRAFSGINAWKVPWIKEFSCAKSWKGSLGGDVLSVGRVSRGPEFGDA
jgi:hypothetical protein